MLFKNISYNNAADCCTVQKNYFKYKGATQQQQHEGTESPAQKNIYKPVAVILMSCSVFISCKKAGIQFGSSFLDNTHTQIVQVDTLTVDASTVSVDSFITNDLATGLTGSYNDPYFGVVTAKSFMEIGPPAYSDTFQNTVFDSLELVLFLNKSYYGDTSKPVTVNIYRLSENIKYASSTSLYNNSSFSYYSNAIGEKTFMLRPNVDDSISIPLSEDIGAAWMSMLASGDIRIKTDADFENYFKGICIASSGGDAVFGFKDSISVRLHFKQKELYPAGKHVDFTLLNRPYQFNNISINRTGTAINNIGTSVKEISSAETNNTAYIQYITGTMAKLRFPYLKDVLQLPGYTGIISAELRVKPVKASFNNLYPLPDALRLVTTDSHNEFGVNITSTDATGVSVVQSGSLQIDELYGISTWYSYDVTAYIKDLLSVTQNNKYGLLVCPMSEEMAIVFNRALIGSSKNSSGAQLIIYYLSVQ